MFILASVNKRKLFSHVHGAPPFVLGCDAGCGSPTALNLTVITLPILKGCHTYNSLEVKS